MNPLMNLKKRPLFALLALILASLACISPPNTYTKGQVACSITNSKPSQGTMYLCTCPATGLQQEITYDHLQSLGDDDIYRQTCGPDVPLPREDSQVTVATETPTATVTPQDTSTPTATATLPPLVSGDVKACSVIEHYINFPLAAGAEDLAGHTLEVTWNGAPVQCEVPAVNQNVLSCVLPRSGQLFPAQISIRIDGQLTDSFTYDGGGCVTTAPTRNDPPPDGIPLCSGVPPYPEGCIVP